MQCNNKIGESFQVHTKVRTMKFKQSEEGSHCHHFSEEFVIQMCSDQEMQLLGTVEDNMIGHTEQQKEKDNEAKNCVTQWEHTQREISKHIMSRVIK